MIKNFQVGESMEFAGVLKGHITVQPVHESLYTKEEKLAIRCVDSDSLPIDRFWQTDTLFAHVYVLTGRNITKTDGSRGSGVSPYIQVVGSEKNAITSDKVFYNTKNPDFYEHFVVPVTVPGQDIISELVLY